MTDHSEASSLTMIFHAMIEYKAKQFKSPSKVLLNSAQRDTYLEFYALATPLLAGESHD